MSELDKMLTAKTVLRPDGGVDGSIVLRVNPFNMEEHFAIGAYELIFSKPNWNEQAALNYIDRLRFKAKAKLRKLVLDDLLEEMKGQTLVTTEGIPYVPCGLIPDEMVLISHRNFETVMRKAVQPYHRSVNETGGYMDGSL